MSKLKQNYTVEENEFHITIYYANGTSNRYDKVSKTNQTYNVEETKQLKILQKERVLIEDLKVESIEIKGIDMIAHFNKDNWLGFESITYSNSPAGYRLLAENLQEFKL